MHWTDSLVTIEHGCRKKSTRTRIGARREDWVAVSESVCDIADDDDGVLHETDDVSDEAEDHISSMSKRMSRTSRRMSGTLFLMSETKFRRCQTPQKASKMAKLMAKLTGI